MIPPAPDQYDTLACLIIVLPTKSDVLVGQSNVADVSHALKGSPGFPVKYGELTAAEAADSPLMGGTKTK